MELNATRPATYWLSPQANWFQTSTMAMQRARPIRIRPVMYSGWSCKNNTASPNINSGPISQFWTSDNTSTRLSANTRCNSSYLTLASGGYIITISPMAMGRLVLPTDIRSISKGSPSIQVPRAMPRPMAAKIHSVR